jgi:hypothetical protein
MSSLTGTASVTVGNGGSGLGGIAGLGGAVTDTVGPVALATEAVDIIGAARVGRASRNLGHVADAAVL